MTRTISLRARKTILNYFLVQHIPASFAHSKVGLLSLKQELETDGALMAYPNVKIPLAYMLLRRIPEPLEKKEDLMDAKKLKLNLDSVWFPGAFSDDNQLLSSESYPHMRLEECLVSIPKMYQGDAVWWHTDIDYNGTEDVSVIYVGAAATILNSVLHVKDQWGRFKKGQPPKDFERGKDQSKFKEYLSEARILGGAVGKGAAGVPTDDR